MQSSPFDLPWLPGAGPGESYVARAALQVPGDVYEVEKIAPELLFGDTIYDCIRAAADYDSTKPAMIHLLSENPDVEPRTITYGQLLRQMTQTANMFRDFSGAQTATVAIILPMLPEALIAAWAACTAGIAVPINPFLEIDSVAAIMNAAGATVLVTAGSGQGDGVWNKVEALAACVPSLKKVLFIGGDSTEDNFVSVLQRYPHDRLTFDQDKNPLRDSFYQPSGGTTDAPKLIRMTQRRQLLNAWINGAMADSSHDGVVGHAMPNFHVGGSVVIALRAVLFGQTLLTLTAEGFRNAGVVNNFWALARHYRMTSVLATPTTAAAILGLEKDNSHGHCLKTFNCGGSTVPLDLLNAFHQKFGVWLREQWGLTEAHGTITGHPTNQASPVVGSVGYNLPYHRVSAFLVDATNRYQKTCAPGERGILVVKGYGTTLGYLDSKLDGGLFVKDGPAGEIWINTGDVGAIDENGYVWLFGRSKDVIVRGGHNIDPKLIEEVLVSHPAVQLAAAVGRPDPQKGELPIAYVQPIFGAKVTPEELIAFCRQHVQERAAVPLDIIIMQSLPLTAVGKIFKPALKNDAIRRVALKRVSDTLGAGAAFSIEIDETGKRSCVVIKLSTAIMQNPVEIRKLTASFEGYEFLTRFEHDHEPSRSSIGPDANQENLTTA